MDARFQKVHQVKNFHPVLLHHVLLLSISNSIQHLWDYKFNQNKGINDRMTGYAQLPDDPKSFIHL